MKLGKDCMNDYSKELVNYRQIDGGKLKSHNEHAFPHMYLVVNFLYTYLYNV